MPWRGGGCLHPPPPSKCIPGAGGQDRPSEPRIASRAGHFPLPVGPYLRTASPVYAPTGSGGGESPPTPPSTRPSVGQLMGRRKKDLRGGGGDTDQTCIIGQKTFFARSPVQELNPSTFCSGVLCATNCISLLHCSWLGIESGDQKKMYRKFAAILPQFTAIYRIFFRLRALQPPPPPPHGGSFEPPEGGRAGTWKRGSNVRAPVQRESVGSEIGPQSGPDKTCSDNSFPHDTYLKMRSVSVLR